MADPRPGTLAGAAGVRALGEAVVPATYDPIDAAYGEFMLREWWSLVRLDSLLGRIPHVVAEDAGRIVGVADPGPKVDRPLRLERIDGNERAASFCATRGFLEPETVANDPWPADIWMRRES